MVKTLIQHIAAEVAINVLFNTVFNNFVRPKIKEQLSRKYLLTKWGDSHDDIVSFHGIEIQGAIEWEIITMANEIRQSTIRHKISVYRDVNPHPDIANSIDLIYSRSE